MLWINKTISGRRHQISTGCKTIEDAIQFFEEFLREHGVRTKAAAKAGAGRRAALDRPELPRGLYWKDNIIWLSRVVDGRHYNVSTGTSNRKLAEQFLADFNLKAFKGEKLGVVARTRITFDDIARRYL